MVCAETYKSDTESHTMMGEDFRIRRVPRGYRVWQRVGSGWEALSDVYSTRADARAAVERFMEGKTSCR